ncbi:MAG: TolC family protein [Singulisphaera sp.]
MNCKRGVFSASEMVNKRRTICAPLWNLQRCLVRVCAPVALALTLVSPDVAQTISPSVPQRSPVTPREQVVRLPGSRDRPSQAEVPERLPQPAPAGRDQSTTAAGAGADYGARTSSAISGKINLRPAAPAATDLPLPINLATALRLADARPLIVTAAQASAWVAEAQLQRAKMIKIPELDFGIDYVRHDGFGPDFNRGVNNPAYGFPGGGGPLNQNLNWMYIGGSFYAVFPTTDAIFQPLAARQVLNSKRHDIQAAKNDALLAAAYVYFGVHQYRGQYAGCLDVVKRGQELTERIKELSRDLVPRIEVDRAVQMVADIQQHAALSRQQWRVASADLTQILRLDPRVVVVPLEPDHLQVTLIDPARPLDELMSIGLAHRPELASQQALIKAAEFAVRREKNRPVLPTILLTGFQSPSGMRMQGMVYGLGYDRNMNNWSLRDDVSLQAIWQLEGLGFGNLARIKKERGTQSQAVVDLFKMQDAIVAEVTTRQADVQAAAVRVTQAERSLHHALITFEGNYEGLAETKRFGDVLEEVYRPQEAIRALQNLLVTYDHYFATVAEYNRAQFGLFHALGYPAREVAALRPPGEYLPVDTQRPAYLPPVGVGPPPATR